MQKTLGEDNEKVKECAELCKDADLQAKHAQARALAFFEFDEMVEWTERVISYAKRELKTPDITELEIYFYGKIKEKYTVDTNNLSGTPPETTELRLNL